MVDVTHQEDSMAAPGLLVIEHSPGGNSRALLIATVETVELVPLGGSAQLGLN